LPGQFILVLTQLPDRASADALAVALIGGRLAACVSIGAPVDSLYHWRGQTETATEIPVVVKTEAARYSQVEAAIRALHPYELPEILAVPVCNGFRPYLDWIARETAAAPPDA
jgi:periplasmic divalent cation tolerance protein